MKIKINDIYLKKKLLLHIDDIEIPHNVIMAIIGENGTGKTLLLRKIFDNCVENNVNVHYVEQSNERIIKNGTVIENIALSESKEKQKKAYQFLTKYHMEHLIEHKISELSGGEKRIVCLARCFIDNADIILIDEPTNDLDYNTVELLKNMLLDLKQYCTIIMVSHDDRMIKLSDEIYQIINKEVKKVKNGNSEKHEKFLENQKKDEDVQQVTKYLKKILKKNIPAYVIGFLMTVLTLYCTFIWNSNDNMEEVCIAENEVDIFSPISQEGFLLTIEGAIPISALSCFDNSMSINQKLSRYNESLKQSEQMPINFGLTLEDNEKYDIFELEYYSLNEKVYYDVMDFYKEKYKMNEDDIINTNQYFMLGIATKDNTDIDLSIKNFKEAHEDFLAKYLESEKLENTFVAVSLKDMDLYSFIQTESVRNLLEGNFYVRSNETIEFVRQIKAFQAKKEALVLMLEIGGALFFMECIIMWFIIFANKVSIIVFYNKGITVENIIKIVQQKYSDFFYKIVLSVCAVLMIFAFMCFGKIESTIATYLNVVVLIVLMNLANKIKNVMIKKYVKHICNWRYR